jgi:F-type H+-transporting ATPase subunit delta
MNESLVIKRYVKALYQLAEEEKIQEKIMTDVQMLLKFIRESPEFASVLENPLIKPGVKSKAIQKIFADDFHPVIINFLLLLIKNRREIYLKNICLFFSQYYKSFFRIKQGILTTAIELAPKFKEEIFNFITRKFRMKVELSEKIDPSIIGGFVLRIEDQQIDASIKTQLKKIKRELIHT